MRSRRSTALLESPTLVGSVILALMLMGVVLSYNASRGLPFVPTYEIRADVPDAAELIEGGSEVRIRGARVGLVQEVRPEEGRDGRRAFARLRLSLDPGLAELPVDSQVEVRPRSLLGAKYLDLIPGRARERLPAGGVLPIIQARPIVEIDEAFNVFDRETTQQLRSTITSAGDSLAGRGAAINDAIVATDRLIAPLQRVLANLASERTDLAGFIRGAAGAMRVLAPLSGTLGSLVERATVTVVALDRVREPLGDAIELLPETETVATRTLRRINPVLDDAAYIARAIRPGSRLLAPSSRQLADAVQAGVPVLRRTPPLAEDLEDALNEVDELVELQSTSNAVRGLLVALPPLRSILDVGVPAQLECNALGLWLRNLGGTASEGDEAGSWLTSSLLFNFGQQLQQAEPAPDLHLNFYPRTGADECEAGNEPFDDGQRIGNPSGRQSRSTEETRRP